MITFDSIKEALRPESLQDISSLPHFITLYCFYRCSLLFKEGNKLSEISLKLIKKMVYGDVKRKKLFPLLKEKYIILVWSIAFAKISGVDISPGEAQGLQSIVQQKFSEWNHDSFWMKSKYKYNVEKLLGKLKLKTKSKKKLLIQQTAFNKEYPTFQVYGPEELDEIF